eukprot:gnl/TRDRNA2_/TRDRNA2_195718_c0_seq1.p1 gnl/TRDRNA2_/TRDRNA2_195718_c0~~gnl/TRDRNA2_/TRDRNA2_195718_c0_seq1.p1  ORF type:complete len:508 (+),score=79.36 gnl/TRDRNA2_/TRDRNA2_195718_c0_seq1:102-1625(+)
MDRAPLPDAYDDATSSGRWRYHDRLGEGGLAVVYRATDMKCTLGEVALKVLRANTKPVHAFELHREAQWSLKRLHCEEDARYDPAFARLFVRCLEDHSGFPTVGDFDAHRRRMESPAFTWEQLPSKVPARQRPYIVLELLPGETLHAATSCSRVVTPESSHAVSPVALPTPLSPEQRSVVLLQLSRACEYLRRFGLAHRDLRACNVQLCRRLPSCEVKVLDLGVAVATEKSLRCNASPAVHVFGKDGEAQPGYDWLPWEVRAGDLNFEWPAHSFDVFSLGVLWLELLTSRAGARGILTRLAANEPWCTVAGHVAAHLPQSTAATALLGRLLGKAEHRPTPSEVIDMLAADADGCVIAPAASTITQAPEMLARGRAAKSGQGRQRGRRASRAGGQGAVTTSTHAPVCKGRSRSRSRRPQNTCLDELLKAQDSLQRMADEMVEVIRGLDADRENAPAAPDLRLNPLAPAPMQKSAMPAGHGMLRMRAAALLAAVQRCRFEAAGAAKATE